MNEIKDEDLRWQEIEKKDLFKTCIYTVTERKSRSPEGKTGDFYVIDAPDWAIVIPSMNDRFLMVKQWRHGEKALSIEFPGGVIEKGEAPEAAAARELKEETGFTAGKLTQIGRINPNPALFSNHVYIYLAEDLKKTSSQNLDEEEFIHYMEIKKKEVYAKMGSPEYPHALMASAMAMYLAREVMKG